MKEKAALLPLSLPTEASHQERRGFARLCALLESAAADGKDVGGHEHWILAAKITKLYEQPLLAAALIASSISWTRAGRSRWTGPMRSSLPRQRMVIARRRRLGSGARNSSVETNSSAGVAFDDSSRGWSAHTSTATGWSPFST